jgi:hypothetical protein
MVSESTPFGVDVKRSSSPERVSQKVPDVVPNFYLGIHLLMGGISLEVRVYGFGMSAELLDDSAV